MSRPLLQDLPPKTTPKERACRPVESSVKEHSASYLVQAQNKTTNWLETLRLWVGTRYYNQINATSEEPRERTAKNELALFAHPLIRAGIFASALIVFISILHFTAPPRGIKAALRGINVIYISKADLCFGEGCMNNPEKIHSVTLPFFNVQSLSDYQDHDLFYRFQINRDENAIKNGLDTVFSPMIWGDAEIYRSGIRVATGPKIQPVINLESPNEELLIHVKSPIGQKFGIRGLVAPFLCDRFLAKSLLEEVNGEEFQIQYSFVAQLAGLCLLLIMFFSFPYRPELFGFLALFGIETLRTRLFYIRDRGDLVISPFVDRTCYNFLLIVGVLGLLFFVATFFRRPLSVLSQFISRHILKVSIAILIGYVVLTSTFPKLSGENALFICLWSSATVLSIALAKDTLLLLFKQKLHARLVLGVAALAGVIYWASANIKDHLVLTNAITTEYTNHLHFFFFMATVLGIEIGRTEVKIREAFSLLPKEVVRLIHEKEEAWREGFVILVDVVGWTSKLKLLSESETPTYMRKINEYLLSLFDEPEASVITGTGDGFFLTFEGPLTAERFEKLTRACAHLAQSRPTFSSLGITFESIKDEQIVVRSALGYGKYYVGFVQTNYLRKDYLAGFIATQLSRVIGNENDPRGPRILFNCPLDIYRKGRPAFLHEEKRERTQYWKTD